MGALAGLLVVAVGCWEEIRYQPPPQAAADSAADAVQQSGVEANAASPGANDPAPPQAPPGSSADAAGATSDVPLVPEPPNSPPTTSPPEPTADEAPIATTAPETVEQSALPVEPAEAGAGFPPPTNRAATADQRRLLWEMASKWSLAMGIYGKGLPAERYQPVFDEAAAAAAKLQLELPPLPESEQASREATIIEALRGEVASALIKQTGERFTEAESAEVRLAASAWLLLLTYLPQSDAAAEQAEAIAAAGNASNLPPELWQPLAKLLEEQAGFLDVRAAVFKLDAAVAKHLAAAK